MSDVTVKHGDKIEIGSVTGQLLEKYNRPGPIHELSHGARLEG